MGTKGDTGALRAALVPPAAPAPESWRTTAQAELRAEQGAAREATTRAAALEEERDAARAALAAAADAAAAARRDLEGTPAPGSKSAAHQITFFCNSQISLFYHILTLRFPGFVANPHFLSGYQNISQI